LHAIVGDNRKKVKLAKTRKKETMFTKEAMVWTRSEKGEKKKVFIEEEGRRARRHGRGERTLYAVFDYGLTRYQKHQKKEEKTKEDTFQERYLREDN